ncbi:hypothetical protein LMIY3S_02726 [Labrys miyagiensis]
MATLVSELVARLKDGISGPAGKAGHSLDALARKGNRSFGGRFLGSLTAGAREAAGALLPLGGAAGAAYFGQKAFRDFAEADRRLRRIGITADATDAQVAGARKQIAKIADDAGVRVDQVVEGLDSLVASGRSLPEAFAFLPSVANTAQASGAAIADMAASADALGSNLKVPAAQMQDAFDILAAAGKSGKFELKDMAQYLPSLAAAANAVGLQGVDGTRKLAAMLQIVRQQTGTAGEAATDLQNVFQKMISQETVNKFKKMGIKDLRGDLDRAKKSGKDVLETFLDIAETALKGDLSKLPLLFNDAQMQAGMRALISQRAELRALEAQLHNTAGTTARDLAKVQNDAQSSVDRFTNSVGNATVSAGRLLDAIGVTREIAQTTKLINDLSDALDRMNTNLSNSGAIGGIFATVQQNAEDRRNDPAKGSWAGPVGDAVLGSDFQAENARLLGIAKQRVEADAEYVSQQVRQNKERQRYAEIVARGTVTAATQERYQRSLRSTEAQMAARRRQIEAERADALRRLRDRAPVGFAFDHPGLAEPRTKDDARRGFYGADGRPVLGPAIPPRAAPAPALPPPRPAEIRVDASQADDAAARLGGVESGIDRINGKAAVVSVQPQGLDETRQKLESIAALISRINATALHMPSGGPARAGAGNYADTGIGH